MVTIQRQRNLSLNAAAFEALGEPSHVVLLFNEGERMIGIKPAAADVDHAYAVRKQARSNSWLFSAQAFLNAYHLVGESAVRYAAEKQGDMLVIDLKRQGVAVGRNAASSRHAKPGE